MYLNFFFTFFVLIMVPLFGVYAADSTAVIELDKIVVRAQRNNILSSNVIDSTVLSRADHSKTADGMLVNLAGIDVKRTSPAAGKGKGVSIRGLDESRSLIMLNGRPLNGSGVMGGSYVDWSSLSLDGVQRIEVIRGAKSAEYGNTFGGVINIITGRDMDSPSRTTVNASYGIVSPEHAKGAYQNRSTDVSLIHHANIRNTASFDFSVGYARGEPFLRNNYFKRSLFGGELTVRLPAEIFTTAGMRATIQNRGFALCNNDTSPYYDPYYPESNEYAGGGPGIKWKGGAYYFGDRSYWKNIRTQTDFTIGKEFPSLRLNGYLFINDQDRTEYFYAVTDTNKLILERFAKPEDHTWGWGIKANQTFKEKHTFIYGFEGTNLRYSSSDIRHIDTAYFKIQPSDGDPEETVEAASTHSAFLQSFINPGKRFTVTPGIRYDYYLGKKRDETVEETPHHGVSPNVGIGVTVWKDGEITAHGAYVHRFPTCPELYWYYGGYQPEDRSELLPEKSIQSELGLSQNIKPSPKVNGTAGIRGYYYIVNDYIRTIFGYKPSRLIYNIDKVTLYGFEIESTWRIADRFHILGNYTYQATEKTGDTYDSSMVLTKGLPELPNHKANAAAEYNTAKGLAIGIAMRFVGERDVIWGIAAMSNKVVLERIDAFTTFRLYGSYPIVSGEKYSAKIKLGVDNLFNTDYEEEPGIPMPGITTTGSIEVMF